jgi:His-Xaa-Ser system radical SAM maturase HxsC
MGRLTDAPIREDRSDWIVLSSSGDVKGFGGDFSGYSAALVLGGRNHELKLPAVQDVPNLNYLNTGDVVQLLPSGIVRVLYRRASEHNTILTTERCNSLCLMCSQPPKTIDDSYRVSEILRLLELINPETREIGLSGGEPTLLGSSFIRIIEKAKMELPQTALHVLTNGRRFKDRSFSEELGAVDHPDLVLGIPLYSDIDWRHDHVVQAKGAYHETLAGLYNLAEAGVRLEIRVVLHRLTIERLANLAEFIARNLPFVEHVALMGLEMFGFTPRNLGLLWIDPFEYRQELELATRALARAGLHVSIYNHQLCTLPRSLWPFAVKSISDWKNVYLPECANCGARELCGGFFQSATKKHSAHIHPLDALATEEVEWLDHWWQPKPRPTLENVSAIADLLQAGTPRPPAATRQLPIAPTPSSGSATVDLS